MIYLIIKHFICDFVLQSNRMAIAKGRASNWFVALFIHSLINALGSFIVFGVLFGLYAGFLVFCAELVFHFVIDKAKVELSRGLTPNDHNFWVLLGLDQSIHYIALISFYSIFV